MRHVTCCHQVAIVHAGPTRGNKSEYFIGFLARKLYSIPLQLYSHPKIFCKLSILPTNHFSVFFSFDLTLHPNNFIPENLFLPFRKTQFRLHPTNIHPLQKLLSPQNHRITDFQRQRE